jgi:hypothetical protein
VPEREAEGWQRWIVLATLGLLAVVNIPLLGSDPWLFRPPRVEPSGVLAPLVRLTDGRWELGFVRVFAVLAALAVVAAAAVALTGRLRSPRMLLALTLSVVVLLVFPAVFLQAGLRASTAPWFYTNDSTYQIELGGEAIASGENPYGRDYSRSGLERFYSRDGTVDPETRSEHVALRHFAYFPGTAALSAVWTRLPSPWSDVRFLVALATVGMALAALLFPATPSLQLSLGALLAANPLSVRAAWFGTADALGILLLVVAFGLVGRARWIWAAGLLATAILVKQFALVALPFFAVMLLRSAPREVVYRAAAVFAGVTLVGFLPFFVADPQAFWSDTVSYGAETYRVIGYGLAALLVKAGVVERKGSYPFLPIALLVWAPFTAWLVWIQVRAREAWVGAVGFTLSIFVLLFIARVFQTSYLLWPLAGLVVAGLLAANRLLRPRGATTAAP